MTRPDYCPVAQEPCQAMCGLSDVRCQLRDGKPTQQPQAEAVQYTRADLDRAYSAGIVEGERLAPQQAEAVPLLSDAELAALMPPPDIDGSKARSPNAVRLAMRAAEQAVRAKMGVAVPMTDEQIRSAREGVWWVNDAANFKAGIRAAEKFHGIVGKEGA